MIKYQIIVTREKDNLWVQVYDGDYDFKKSLFATHLPK